PKHSTAAARTPRLITFGSACRPPARWLARRRTAMVVTGVSGRRCGLAVLSESSGCAFERARPAPQASSGLAPPSQDGVRLVPALVLVLHAALLLRDGSAEQRHLALGEPPAEHVHVLGHARRAQAAAPVRARSESPGRE
ncbi:unnamed protein product, partial [Prorocentrum cordatum]